LESLGAIFLSKCLRHDLRRPPLVKSVTMSTTVSFSPSMYMNPCKLGIGGPSPSTHWSKIWALLYLALEDCVKKTWQITSSPMPVRGYNNYVKPLNKHRTYTSIVFTIIHTYNPSIYIYMVMLLLSVTSLYL